MRTLSISLSFLRLRIKARAYAQEYEFSKLSLKYLKKQKENYIFIGTKKWAQKLPKHSSFYLTQQKVCP